MKLKNIYINQKEKKTKQSTIPMNIAVLCEEGHNKIPS